MACPESDQSRGTSTIQLSRYVLAYKLMRSIRIHQLTLPESLALSHQRDLQLSEAKQQPTFPDPPSSKSETSASAGPSRPRARATSSSSHGPAPSDAALDIPHGRPRSGSTSTFVPSSPPATLIRPRTTRPRAPTLAGEALEHAHEVAEAVKEERAGQAVDGEEGSGGAAGEEADEEGQEGARRILARCFVVLRLLPRKQITGNDVERNESGEEARTEGGKGVPFPLPARSASGDAYLPGLTRSASSASARGSSDAFARPALHPSTSTRSLRISTAPRRRDTRERTTSLQSSGTVSSSIGVSSTDDDGASGVHERASTSPTTVTSPVTSNAPRLGSRQPRLVRAPSDAAHTARRPTISRPSSMYARRAPSASTSSSVPSSPMTETFPSTLPPPAGTLANSAAQPADIAEMLMPFYISPIHRPSTHPRFLHLSASADFGSWLSPVDSAGSKFMLEVWYEDPMGEWARVPDIGGHVDLGNLRRVEKGTSVPDNTLEFTLDSDPRGVYYLEEQPDEEEVGGGGRGTEQPNGDPQAPVRSSDHAGDVRGVMERSLRETRMKRGAGVGALHQLVNTQAVLAGTQSSINSIITSINGHLAKDAGRQAIERDIAERTAKVEWLRKSVAATEEHIGQVKMRIQEEQRRLGARRDLLERAEKNAALNVEVAMEKQTIVQGIMEEAASLSERTHLLRASHVQALDSLFPIVPLDPSTLLYSILDVPLPIPTGATDRTPPIMLPARKLPDGRTVKVDEQTTAAALGYVALVLQVLVGLGGSASKGLGYPVTYAGSRSLVKDVTSVMTGPRSFPLYTKGVERYRFEYAVFLLNKNIDIMMQDANIRLVDARHTLPNLKALLLTLSSPTLPPPRPLPSTRKSSGHSTFVNSRTASRQTSYAYAGIGMTRGVSSVGSSVSGRNGLQSPRASLVPFQVGMTRGMMGQADVKMREKGNEIDLADDQETVSSIRGDDF